MIRMQPQGLDHYDSVLLHYAVFSETCFGSFLSGLVLPHFFHNMAHIENENIFYSGMEWVSGVFKAWRLLAPGDSRALILSIPGPAG